MLGKKNLFLVGPMGAGKTTIGRMLAENLRRTFYDTDLYIEAATGVNLSWIFDIEGEAGFILREEKAIDSLTRQEEIVLATGGNCVFSAKNREILAARGVVVYLQLTLDKQVIRTKREHRRPLLQNISDKKSALSVIEAECAQYYEAIADFTVSTNHGSVREICDDILQLLLAK